ncbi:MAG: aspartate--ammonia ligase [Acholeplasmatales bacterium]|nr:aspartate--ammonia ligase [Acholeplasmatales bacterium]
MKKLILPEGYKSELGLLDTEIAIKFVKDTFERDLADKLNLTRVSAPLFVFPKTGLNDNLNGYERRVSFDIKNIDAEVEIVQSLAKWKRNALARYAFLPHTGLYTDMNAIRRDEDLDTMHSAYVDQWDWEKIIVREDRNVDFLKKTVKDIYEVIKLLEHKVSKVHPHLYNELPEDIFFITSEELLQMYPNLEPSEREYEITKKYKAVFLLQIGKKLSNGMPHDGRAADYDDWDLNGDILLYYDVLDIAFEISSMGIRVDENSILTQLKEKKEEFKIENPYVQDILNKRLPLTIGGGIGQSRLCMFMLRKAHIGEVQSSIWSDEDLEVLKKANINLL